MISSGSTLLSRFSVRKKLFLLPFFLLRICSCVSLRSRPQRGTPLIYFRFSCSTLTPRLPCFERDPLEITADRLSTLCLQLLRQSVLFASYRFVLTYPLQLPFLSCYYEADSIIGPPIDILPYAANSFSRRARGSSAARVASKRSATRGPRWNGHGHGYEHPWRHGPWRCAVRCSCRRRRSHKLLCVRETHGPDPVSHYSDGALLVLHSTHRWEIPIGIAVQNKSR